MEIVLLKDQRKAKIMFLNRKHAAHLLSDKLVAYKDSNSVVVAMPRGVVPVGYHLAAELHLPLEVIPCKRIEDAVDSHKSIGSVSLDGVALSGENLNIPQDYICHQVAQLKHRLQAQNQFYNQDRHPIDVNRKVVILVDDRMESESQMLACLRSVRNQMPERIIVAVPVATPRAAQKVRDESDDFICLLMPSRIEAPEAFYEYLPAVTDDEVKFLLLKAGAREENGVPASI